MIRAIALFLTVMTGFSGLVYEVAWQKYLATLLGSHSEATAAVLGIFLGGLSVGYWLFGVATRRVVERAEQAGRPPRLLLVYGALEASIGVYVLVFPWLFKVVQQLSYLIPHGVVGVGFAIDVLLASLLIGPASILMGGTIPMLTQALSRSLEDATRFHAFVYAFNTGGAFVGALAAGFYLVPQLGLVSVMHAMGMINLVAGAVFVGLGLRGRNVASLAVEEAGSPDARPEGFLVYAMVALLTGFSMMAMQTTLIRIAGLSFGSSQFTFSMVVACFVLCIALGSFVVSALSRIPASLVVLNQWALPAAFLVLYPRLPESPYWVYVLRTLFQDTDAAFAAYYFVGFLGVLTVIGAPVLLSGAALPLLFHHLRREVGHLGDLAGNLYSWNTVGSLLGALVGGYLLLFWLDLHHVYRVAIASLLIAALLLTMQVHAWPRAALLALVPLLGFVALLPPWLPSELHMPLVRERRPAPGTYEGFDAFVAKNPQHTSAKIVFADDDPTTSVTVREYPFGGNGRSLSVFVNGKSDSNTHVDRLTTILSSVMPALMAEKAERAFVVGWGTGVTVGEAAAFESMKHVDVAEISPAVMQAAPLFDFANQRASQNPKIRVVHSDAYRALMQAEGKYDLIISEPSNPWVAGVEMLYSREFLSAARSRLEPGGVYCQWVHVYEMDDASLSLVLRTYAEVFEHVAVWGTRSGDLMLLGLDQPGFATDQYRLEERANRPDLQAALRRAGIESFPALLAHEIAPMGVVHAAGLEGVVHTLYHPRLNDLAGRAFFRAARAELPFTGAGAAARVGRENSLLRAYALRTGGTLPDEVRAEVVVEACRSLGHHCFALLAEWLSEEPESESFRRIFDWISSAMTAKDDYARARLADSDRLHAMARLFAHAKPSIRAKRRVTPDDAAAATRDFQLFYNHAAPFDGEALIEIWESCREPRVQISEEHCREKAEREALTTGGVSVEQRVQRCLGSQLFGPRCEAGLAEARALLGRE